MKSEHYFQILVCFKIAFLLLMHTTSNIHGPWDGELLLDLFEFWIMRNRK